MHFGAVEQERELPTGAKLLYRLCPSGEGATCQERKRGDQRPRGVGEVDLPQARENRFKVEGVMWVRMRIGVHLRLHKGC